MIWATQVMAYQITIGTCAYIILIINVNMDVIQDNIIQFIIIL